MGRYEKHNYRLDKDEKSGTFRIHRWWSGTVNKTDDYCCKNLKIDVLNVMKRIRGGEWVLLDPYYRTSYLQLNHYVPMLESVLKLIFEQEISELHINNPIFTIDFRYDYLKGNGNLRIIKLNVEKEDEN